MNRRPAVLALAAVIFLTFAVGTAEAQGKKKNRGIRLPKAVAEALKAECADCTIVKVSKEVEDGVKTYDFEFLTTQGEMDVAADGTVLSRETPVDVKDVPEAAMAAIRKAAAGAKIKMVEKEEVRAELKDGKIIKVDSPKYAYEADLTKGNRVAEVSVTPDGQVTEGPKWKKRGAKED